MFLALLHQRGGEPACIGPFATFAEAAARGGERVALVVEFSPVHGWLSIWERLGDRFECVLEAPAADRLRMEVPR